MQTYTISEIAEKMGVSAHTIRFYDKEGLLPKVERVNGRRIFKDSDFRWLRILNCLKSTGMPLSEIKQYLELCDLGDQSLLARQEIILKQKANILKQIELLNYHLKEINYKVWYYEMAIQAGTEKVHENNCCAPSLEPDCIPEHL